MLIEPFRSGAWPTPRLGGPQRLVGTAARG